MKMIAFAVSVVAAFAAGYWVGSHDTFEALGSGGPEDQRNEGRRVTGIGGVFFKSENPQKLKEWYAGHLGLGTDEYGTNFVWRHADDKNRKGFTQWSPFKSTTDYFKPSEKEFMLNYRVRDIDRLIAELKDKGVPILDEVEEYDYGRFVHIMDPEGNKIELWEPNDAAYEKIVDGVTQ